VLPLLVNTGFQVLFHSPPGVLFTFPSRYYALSVTISYLGLEGGPSCFPPDFSCPAVLWYRLAVSRFRVRVSHPLRRRFPTRFHYPLTYFLPAHNPGKHASRFGLFPFRSPLLRKSMFLSFPPGTEMFQFPGCPSAELCIHSAMTGLSSGRVSPFGYLRINACLRLLVAFRSLPRPSSAYGALASTLCSSSLDFFVVLRPFLSFASSESLHRTEQN
jgi:hypothetical protein